MPAEIVSPVIIRDDSIFKSRLPDKALLDSFRNDPAFRYKKYAAVGKSFFERFIEWLGRLFHTKPGSFAYHFLGEYLWYILFFIIIVFIIYRLFKSDIRGLFIKSSRKIHVSDVAENVHELDFDRLIMENIAAGQFRYAIRLYYLKALKLLDAKGLISWSPEKTNREYLSAVKNSVVYNDFQDVTYIFNSAWYGEFSIDETLFREAEKEFVRFNQTLQSR